MIDTNILVFTAVTAAVVILCNTSFAAAEAESRTVILTLKDELSESTWARNNFKADRNHTELTYTSSRVLADVYNTYDFQP